MVMLTALDLLIFCVATVMTAALGLLIVLAVCTVAGIHLSKVQKIYLAILITAGTFVGNLFISRDKLTVVSDTALVLTALTLLLVVGVRKAADIHLSRIQRIGLLILVGVILLAGLWFGKRYTGMSVSAEHLKRE